MTDKWKGVERLAKEVCYAVFDNESDEPSVDVAEAKLRERLVPLLDAVREGAEYIRNDEAYEKLQKKVATWR